MFVINAVLISGRLRLSPLRFLRHDFAKKGKSHAVRLPNFRFFSRFRLRILLQNKSSYFTLFLGIVFANILLLFGMMMKPAVTLPDGGGGKYAGRLPVYFKCPGSDR